MNRTLSSIVLAILFVSTPALLTAGDQPVLSENLQPLKPYLGNWTLHWTEPDGKPMSGKGTIKSDAGGNIVTARVEVTDPEGALIYTRVEVFFWRAETKSLANIYFDSNGLHGENVFVSQTGSRLLWQGGGYGNDGKPGQGTREMQKVDENTWTARFLRVTDAGQPVPDSPKFTFTREK